MEKVLLLLKRLYHVVPVEDIEKFYYQGRNLKHACHITFDDGDKSFYKTVFPLLKKHQIPVSIYVSPLGARENKNFWFQEIRGYDPHKLFQILTNIAGQGENASIPLNALLKSIPLNTIWEAIYDYQQQTGTPPKPGMNMDQKELRELHDSGLVDIGAHTMNHPILANEDAETSGREIKKSVHELGDLLNTRVKYFAYPNGTIGLDFGIREMDVLKEAGIKLAFSTEKKSLDKGDNPMSVPRNGITKGNTGFILGKLIAGSRWDKIKKSVKGKQESDFRCGKNTG